jgi:hypothetical protein
MITTGSKYFFGLATASAIAAAVYAYGTGGGLLGVLTLGLYGGAGEHIGFVILGVAAISALFLGCVTSATRDADAEQVAAYAGLAAAPDVPHAQGNSYWPAVGAFGASIAIVGLVENTQITILGGLILVLAFVEWMVGAWSDRATGDPVANRKIRNRFMYPFEVPIFGAIGIFFMVLCISRILLALSKNGSAFAAITIAVVILGTATIINFAPKAGRTVIGILCLLGAVAVITGGIIAGAHGTREFGGEEHEVHYTPADRNQSPAGALVDTSTQSESSTSSSSN